MTNLTPEQMAKCREAFEQGTGLPLRKEMYGDYADPYTAVAWDQFKRGAAWSAAQTATIDGNECQMCLYNKMKALCISMGVPLSFLREPTPPAQPSEGGGE